MKGEPTDFRLSPFLVWADIVFYSLTLLIAIYVTIRYLILRKKCKIMHMVAFYSLTALVAVSRIIYCAEGVMYLREGD